MIVLPVMGQSFLKATKFAPTAADLSFIQRMELAAEGFSGFESEYDENGNCISGCAYPGIKIEDEIEYGQRVTDMAKAALLAQGINIDDPCLGQPCPGQTTPPTTTTVTPTTATPGTASVTINIPAPGTSTTAATSVSQTSYPPAGGTEARVPIYGPGSATAYNCADYNPDTPANLVIPVHANPLKANPVLVSSPFGARSVHKGSSYHRGLDLSGTTGTPVYATAAGTVVTVKYQGEGTKYGCGKYVEIQHDQGYKTQYCHLSQQNVTVGMRIAAGCKIGEVGNTGGAGMAPHLHYRINWTGSKDERSAVDAAPYLKPGKWRCKPGVAQRPNCKQHQHLQAK